MCLATDGWMVRVPIVSTVSPSRLPVGGEQPPVTQPLGAGGPIAALCRVRTIEFPDLGFLSSANMIDDFLVYFLHFTFQSN